MYEFCEKDIIDGCKKHNPIMQKRLYEKFYSLFLKICIRYTQNEQDAENILHDSFIKIFKNISEYESKGSFEGWMKKIVVNCCLDFLRSKSSKNMKQTALPESFDNFEFTNKDANAIDQISMKELLKLIHLLPTVTQTVFNLFIFEGYSHKEISKALTISEGTSQWHVNNARKFLQQKLKNYVK
jgi:RNA polymerase sigma factor (sigma-70 family)